MKGSRAPMRCALSWGEPFGMRERPRGISSRTRKGSSSVMASGTGVGGRKSVFATGRQGSMVASPSSRDSTGRSRGSVRDASASPRDVRRSAASYSLFVLWYNEHRSHSYLVGRTPNEVYRDLPPACENPRYEPRPNWPKQSKYASPQALAERKRSKSVQLDVRFLEGRRHLPVVSLRRAA